MFLRFDVESEIENTIQDVSGAIIKLDDISGRDLYGLSLIWSNFLTPCCVLIPKQADIFTLIGNSREGAAAKKRRQLERKLNSMKTDMEKLNMKLLEAKDEVKSREARCYELQTLVTMRENKIKVLPWWLNDHIVKP